MGTELGRVVGGSGRISSQAQAARGGYSFKAERAGEGRWVMGGEGDKIRIWEGRGVIAANYGRCLVWRSRRERCVGVGGRSEIWNIGVVPRG